MGNPYTDRLNEITRLRAQRDTIDRQIQDEIAKAWRLSPTQNLEAFAATIELEAEAVRQILADRGIVVRLQPTLPGLEV